jgi:hypothetical protein
VNGRRDAHFRPRKRETAKAMLSSGVG